MTSGRYIIGIKGDIWMFDLPFVAASLIFTKDRRHQKDKEDAVVFHCLVHRLCKILETMQKDSVQSVSWQNIQESNY